jgi:hypothetical protein
MTIAAPPASDLALCAVAWIDEHHAIIATSGQGGISTCTIKRGSEPESAYHELVIRAIGDRQRVVIMGPSFDRIALERAYVAMYQRPDRLVDVEPSEPIGEAALIERLRQLAG